MSVHDTLKRKHFAAQVSMDQATWTDLVGQGKTRRLSGYAAGSTLAALLGKQVIETHGL